MYSTGNSLQYLVINCNVKEYKKNIYLYNYITLLYSRSKQNSVNKLYFSIIYKKKGVYGEKSHLEADGM